MNAVEIIAKKRDGGELTRGEIAYFVTGVTQGSLPDYQASAWLMAVFLKGMTARETLDLTLEMRDSGQRIDLSDLPGTLDKHSTGGVGDKTTLVAVPMLAALGVPMLKMSGRGLGFSGGTVDKLESIPGFRTDLTIAEAKAQVRRIGAALIGQTAELAPADKILYGLRDVTATVESIPLIASSILSKKLAAGAARIVLDVKVGRGAFMKTRAAAEELARTLVAIGEGAGIPTSAVLTAMEEPLGECIGNALEVREAIDALQPDAQGGGTGLQTFRALCVELVAHSLVIVGKARNTEEGRAKALDCLQSGAAAAKFAEIVAAQGGPNRDIAQIRAALPVSPSIVAVPTSTAGYVSGIDAEAVGRLAMAMGAGREEKTDSIDSTAGIVLHYKTGDSVPPGASLADLHLKSSDVGRAEAFASALKAAYAFASEGRQVARPPLVLDTL